MRFEHDEGNERVLRLHDRFGDTLKVSTFDGERIYVAVNNGPGVQISKSKWIKLKKRINKELGL